MEGLNFKPRPELQKPLNIAAIVISVVVLALVGIMRRPDFKIHTAIDFSFLAPFHASVNALCALSLIIAFYFVYKKKYDAHRNMINLAMVFSAIFLSSYVLYHFTTEETRFCGEGAIRKVYFFLLISHIVLAGLLLPFILITYTRAFTGRFQMHKKMARFVGPLWLYVAITGPILYLMLRPCY